MSFQKWFFAYNFFSSGPRGLKFGMTLRSIKIAQHAKFQPFRSIRKRIRAFFWLKMHISRDIALKSRFLAAEMLHRCQEPEILDTTPLGTYKSTCKVSGVARKKSDKVRLLPDYRAVTRLAFLPSKIYTTHLKHFLIYRSDI